MSEPITIIGANTVVSGNLEGDEDLTVEGRVEGSINLSKTLTIEINGVVHANINVRNAVISGVLVGNVQAEECVHVTEEGRVVGDIAAPRVILVDGASFRGSIDMGDFDVERTSTAGAATAGLMEVPKRPTTSFGRESKAEASAPAPARLRKPSPPVRPVTTPARPTTTPAPTTAAETTPAAEGAAPHGTPPEQQRRPAPAPTVRSVSKAKVIKKRRA